ncbi:hypothetical protein MtrunA17_Chr2g0321791 [Medicago truncatula]|uniref:Uncharacterized protein n=1 Tax=Medicago truncatula TaxID=3880 RepID=A0A396JGL0_MEDTR|nr:hypothetical protein MtrunA17_Chr2g0321791 [Medicago truncatula]
MEVLVFWARHWKNRGTMGSHRGTMVRWRIKIKHIFGSRFVTVFVTDLLQILGRFVIDFKQDFYYKYRPCIKANLESRD